MLEKVVLQCDVFEINFKNECTFNCAPVYSSGEYYKDNILLLNGSHLFSVISYVVLIVINHPKL